MPTCLLFEVADPNHSAHDACDYVIGLGSNLGDRLGHLRQAVAAVAACAELELTGLSPVYESEPVGPSQPHYLNAALRLRTGLAPRELLRRLLQIELQAGRERTERWGPRTLDLDILWSQQGVRQPGLRVPHRELTHRWFALQPLLDVAPELRSRYGPALQALGGVRASQACLAPP